MRKSAGNILSQSGLSKQKTVKWPHFFILGHDFFISYFRRRKLRIFFLYILVLLSTHKKSLYRLVYLFLQIQCFSNHTFFLLLRIASARVLDTTGFLKSVRTAGCDYLSTNLYTVS